MESFAFMQGFFDFYAFYFYQNQTLLFCQTKTKNTPKKSKLTKNLINVPAKKPKNEPVAALKARFPSFEL